eukprot:TRINITY_DN728_c0_g1_i4.p1 TRINITY_DN728_c0_g1~~TRINITY_DN728_c0_g1_i4.p1  ORF type:complete len:599 (+),score=110.56 TRINITY_DN728_c0_g1_i4:1-1797(+)
MCIRDSLGDIPAKFQWDTIFCKHFFTITPEKGVIHAHEDIFFEITFHPSVVGPDIRFMKVKCNIIDADPLYMNLLGKCIPQTTENIEDIKFDTIVRKQVAEKTIIKNPTPQVWRVKANISTLKDETSGYFTGPNYLEIPANGQAEYIVQYKPLTMTKNDLVPGIKDEVHEGTLFFPLPNGTAKMINLYGKAQPPQPIDKEAKFKAKKTHTYILEVQNWLKTTQRFQVTWRQEVEDQSILVNGANTIDVTGEGLKQYKLTLYALKQTQSVLIVTFKNDVTHEFLSFRIKIIVEAPETLAKIELSSVVREASSTLITIENPFDHSVELKKENLVCDNDNVTFNPLGFTINKKQEFGLEIIYRPLTVSDINSKFLIKSPELGDFTYDLHLIGLPTSTQRQLTFKTALGSEIYQQFKFINYVKKQNTYTCKIEKLGQKAPVQTNSKEKQAVQLADFTTDTATVAAPPADSYDGTEVVINIKFEPSSLSDSRALLTVSSPEGGEYQCLLQGQAFAPQPKGPFTITAKSYSIEFKNPFFESQEFTIRIDNPCFTTSAKNPVKIDAKKTLGISLTYKAQANLPNTGRMMVSTGELPPWIFYLEGE